ncbi:serine/threonine protein kinase [Geodermatophilus sabuli]|uniref:non-specific serine/threonine protein kinase n=1 Tax=Geodermatophilus sabuli TaxID=1564158 RepID=A0A7K3W887_9ACTN|nr:serine/threonine-protein kinase [Geodermatophilus sabuli]NEK60330.1 serine/threonine protein kinase [Geodermatophilus sabuli]NEK60583.1 serine/threonine protein kinase [Geodermatophilus sabuli]
MPSTQPPGPREPLRPPVVPGYRLEELLGRGGSGEVWRAVPRAGGAPVAVKVLVAGDAERQAREAALLGELDHPHLVRLVEVVHQPRRGRPPRVALVLDLLPGGSLAALLARRGRLRPGEVVTAIAPVAAALAHAHDRGVVHGDLSPGNVVFTAEGRPVLTDLGVARVLGEDAAGEVTPAYVDPTVARGGAPGPASDVFGLAAAAFHALTGVPPWNGATPADVLRVAAEGSLPDLAELASGAPDELLAVIARGLSPHPHERGSAAAFALDLRHACRPEPVRLPLHGVPDEDLGRTGHGPRTELTHQVPGRHRPAPDEPIARPVRERVLAAGPVLRRSAAVVVALGLLATVVWLGGRWGDPPAAGLADRAASSTRTSVPSPPGRPEPPEQQAGAAVDSPQWWRAVLTGLYARRAEALRPGGTDRLDDVHTAGSPLLSSDRGTVASLVAAGEDLRGFAPVVEEVAVLDGGASEGRVTLAVTDTWPAYEVVAAADPDGPALRTVEARGTARVRLTLVGSGQAWLLDAAERVG